MSLHERSLGSLAENGADDRLWTPEDVALFLGVPVRTLYAWRSRGEGPPALRIGKHLRYRKSQLDAWLDAQADVERKSR